MGTLNGKVAIVTGAGKGLGRSEAIAIAKEGAAVAVVARTYEDVLDTANAIREIGGTALPLKCDVRNREQVNRVVKDIVAEFGSVDILVNNAQIMYPPHPLEEWSDEEMRATWESGPLGSWYFMLACFPYMKTNGGRIINFCSPAGHGNLEGFGGYSIAKEAIRSLTRCAAREWGKYGITVNAVSPIGLTADVAAHYDTNEKREAVYRQLGTALKRFGDPEADIGRCVVFLAGPDAGYVTGCTLGVDGGSAML